MSTFLLFNRSADYSPPLAIGNGGTTSPKDRNKQQQQQIELQQQQQIELQQQQNGGGPQHFHSISLRSAADQPIVLNFDGPCNGTIGVGPAGAGGTGNNNGGGKGQLIGTNSFVANASNNNKSKKKWPHLAATSLGRLLRSRRFLRIMVALLSLLALLLIVSLVWVILISNEQRQQLEEDAEFLNKDSSWRSNGCQRKCNANFDVPPLLLISMDGFRADYLLRNKTHAVSRILQCGSSAQYMLPSYPSKTFPNHFTIVTGLYPESHGIVDNHFFDERMQMKFSKTSRDAAWYNGEPIWNTVMKNGKKAAIFFWPGSEVPIQGMLPSYRYAYNASLPFSKRVDQVIEWLRLDDTERPAFLAMYFEQPDTAAHHEGPDSDAVNSALIYVDAMINYLLQQLDENGFLGCINLVILSDHGGQKLREDHFVSLDEFVDAKDPNVGGVFGGTVGHINFRKTASPVLIDQVFTKMSCTGGQTYRVYGRDSMPIRYHYTRNERIGEIVVDSVGGAKLFVDKQSLREYGPKEKGDHGYDNRMREMRALFGAWGPSIKQSYEVKPFQNIELYNLFTTLMQLPVSAPNNGTLGRLHPVLRSPPPLEERQMIELPECDNVRLVKCGDGCHFELNYQAQSAGQERTAEQKQASSTNAAKVPVYNSQRCKYAEHILVPAGLQKQGQLCLVRMCNATMVFNRRIRMVNYVESLLSAPIPNIDHRANCSAHFVMPPSNNENGGGNAAGTNDEGGGVNNGNGNKNGEQQQQQLVMGSDEMETNNGNLTTNSGGKGKMERSADNDADNLVETNDPISADGNSSPPWDRPSEAENAIDTTRMENGNITMATTARAVEATISAASAQQQQQLDGQLSAHRRECDRLKAEQIDLVANGGNSNNNNGQQPAWISLFPDNDYARYIVQGQFRVPVGFYNGPWKQLLSLIRQYVQHYKQLLMWTGPVFDHDHNGIADPKIFTQPEMNNNAFEWHQHSSGVSGNNHQQQQQQQQLLPPSHIFLILMRCSNNSWHSSSKRCEQPERVKTLAFVLPLLDKDLNCLFPVEYIFRHTTAIRDIELLTGNEWFTDRDVYPPELAIQLRTQLNEQLWQLEVHS